MTNQSPVRWYPTSVNIRRPSVVSHNDPRKIELLLRLTSPKTRRTNETSVGKGETLNRSYLGTKAMGQEVNETENNETKNNETRKKNETHKTS